MFSAGFFVDSWLCHRLSYILCSYCELEWEQLYIMLVEDISMLKLYNVTQTAIAHCLRLLERRGLIEQVHEKDEELLECEEKAKQDKRVKNPTKYCLQRGRGSIRNIIKAKPGLCASFIHYLETQEYILTLPAFSCGGDGNARLQA